MDYYINQEGHDDTTHYIKITFQTEDYKGDIVKKTGGNCYGLTLLDFSEWDHERLYENNCNLTMNEDDEYSLDLTNAKGEILQVEYLSFYELEKYVVSMEIVECREVE